jgi:hypothetical protein
MDLSVFVASTLNRAGGVAECDRHDLVEAILPPAVAAALGLSEEARLRVRGAAEAEEVHAGFGTSLLAQICALQAGASHRFRAALAPSLPRSGRVREEAERVLTFQNGVGRMEALEESVLNYLVFDFRYEALSEEKHEGLLSIAVAGDMGWTPDLPQALSVYLAGHPHAGRPWPEDGQTADLRPGYARARALAMARAREAAEGFIARMARRLRRDTRRVEEYYGDLEAEVEKRRGRETPERLRSKVEAIGAERTRRLHDLQRRHAVTMKVAPLCVLVLATSGLTLRARLHRRKNDRRVQISWNPITREFDRWLCEGCGDAAGLPALCDAMHLLCARCAGSCAACRVSRPADAGATARPPGRGPYGTPPSSRRGESRSG